MTKNESDKSNFKVFAYIGTGITLLVAVVLSVGVFQSTSATYTPNEQEIKAVNDTYDPNKAPKLEDATPEEAAELRETPIDPGPGRY